MVFSSDIFLFVFAPAFFLVYCPAPFRFKNAILLAANLVFYMLGTGTHVWVLMVSILGNFLFGRWIADTEESPRKTALLWAALIFNLSFLIWYKYTAFLLGGVEDALRAIGLDLHIAMPPQTLPLGISFFTFQAISYIADIYLEQVRPARTLVDFGMYHSLFPQLLAGPIVRYSEIEGEVARRRLDWAEAAAGTHRFMLGLGKKLLIANPIGEVSDAIFALPQGALSAEAAWLGAVAYAFQVYYDFSGYSDMAIGLGRILGFTFPENFNQPFRAQSITEFWRRWHMTLFRWLRDYLFIPLGGFRPGLRSYLALVFVFIVCGLWHGAAMTYVAWGFYQAVLLAAERYVITRYGRVQKGLWAMALTFVLTLFGIVVIRCPDLAAAMRHLAIMLGHGGAPASGTALPVYLGPDKLFIFAVAAVFAWLPVERLKPGAAVLRFRYAASLGVFLLSVVALSASSFNPFIYFRF
jgi:alginate O-acetyltransferase complex protein AlgI